MILLALLLLLADVQWTRAVLTQKGNSQDTPDPHPLAYYKDQWLREYGLRGVAEPVGSVESYPIIDVLYKQNSAATMKSILVKVGPDEYREIFSLNAYYAGVSLSRSRIIGDVLVTMDPDGGNGGSCWEQYWRFDRSGPHLLDFSRIGKAIMAAVPSNTNFQMTCSALDVEARQIRTNVQKNDARCHACGWVGQVTARFRLDGPVLQPVSVRFEPKQMACHNAVHRLTLKESGTVLARN